MAEGNSDEVKGRLKEAAGSLLGDDKMKKEGRADQKAGKAKEAVNDVIDSIKDAVTGKGKGKKDD